MKRAVVITAAVVLVSGHAGARLIVVPDDYPSIKAAVAVAHSGDTVLVRAGTYRGAENRGIGFGGRDIVLLAEDGPGATVIDCEWQNRGFCFTHGESPAAVVDGFTIFAGLGMGDYGGQGGGAFVLNSSPTIRNCVFCSCRASVGTAGHSYSWSAGGGLTLASSASTVSNCVFLMCTVSLGCMDPHGSAISGTATGQIRNCLIDQCTPAGGAIIVQPSCVVYRCVADSCVSAATGPSPENNLWSVDPLVCDWPLAEWGHPCINSPALPENNPWGELVGVSSTLCSSCDSPVESRSWGSIKALYR